MSLIQELCQKATFQYGKIIRAEKVIVNTNASGIVSMYNLYIEYLDGNIYEHKYFPDDDIHLFVDKVVPFDCIVENSIKNVIFVYKNLEKHS
ncbi:TPA: hypothetical protein ACK3QK_004573 [Enterobacter cloacae]